MIISYIVEKFLNLLYQPFAFLYDAVAYMVSRGAWKDWVRSVSQFIKGEKVLELGFGTGTLLAHLANSNLSVIGIDQSRQMIKIARKRTGHVPGRSVIELIRASAIQLPFYSNCFETVVATFPSNYIFHPNTLAGIHRVLEDKGQLLILLSAEPHKNNLFGKFLAWLYSVTGQSNPQPDARFKVIHSLLAESNFDSEIVTIQTNNANLFIVRGIPYIKRCI